MSDLEWNIIAGCGSGWIIYVVTPSRVLKARIRAGRSDPCPGPRPGPDSATPRSRLSCGGSGASLSEIGAGGRLLRQLRIFAARESPIDASAHRAHGLDGGARRAGGGGAGIR